MKWFSFSSLSSILMGRPSTSEVSLRSEISIDVASSPKPSNKAETSVGQAAVSTTKTKSTHGVSQSSSTKKQSSGIKNVKRRRGRPPKKSAK